MKKKKKKKFSPSMATKRFTLIENPPFASSWEEEEFDYERRDKQIKLWRRAQKK